MITDETGEPILSGTSDKQVPLASQTGLARERNKIGENALFYANVSAYRLSMIPSAKPITGTCTYWAFTT